MKKKAPIRPAVDDQRLDVRDREVPDLEEAEIEHRVAIPRLPDQEEGEDRDPADQPAVDHRVAPAVLGLLDQREDRGAQADRREERSRASRCAGRRPGRRSRARSGGRSTSSAGSAARSPGRWRARRTPRSAPRPRPDRSRWRFRSTPSRCPTARPRSSPSKVAARMASEPGTSSAPAKPCRASRPDQDGRSSGAIAQRIEVTPNRPSPRMKMRRRPNWSPSEPPTSSSDDQGEQVGLDHPLLIGEADSQIVAERRERDVDHSRVEEDDGRAQDRRDDGEAGCRRASDKTIESTEAVSAGRRKFRDSPHCARRPRAATLGWVHAG